MTESLQNNEVSPFLRQEIVKLLHQSIPPTFVTLQTLQQQVVNLECVFLSQLPHLSKIFNICSGGETKPPAEALAARLNRMTKQIRQLEF